MLVRYSVENFLSIKDKIFLDMVPGMTRTHKDHIVSSEHTKVLSCAAMYGPNASGKSNIIRSIAKAQEVVRFGLNSIYVNDQYFKLCKEYRERSSSFQFEILKDGSYYIYGFDVLFEKKLITAEWLYTLNSRHKPVSVFETAFKDDVMVVQWGDEFIPDALRNRLEIYREDYSHMVSDLFLKNIAEKRIEHEFFRPFHDVLSWFRDDLQVITPQYQYTRKILSGMGKTKEEYRNILSSFGIEIEDLTTLEPTDQNKFIQEMIEKTDSPVFVEQLNSLEPEEGFFLETLDSYILIIKDEERGFRSYRLNLSRKRDDGEIIPFAFASESDGTKRLFDFIPILMDLDKKVSHEKTLVIDELERSFHPALTRRFIDTYLEHANNDQLILATHEMSIMSLDVFRRDEIWFVDMEGNKGTRLYSLDKFKDRFDKVVSKAYLLGRYGALPMFSNWK